MSVWEKVPYPRWMEIPLGGDPPLDGELLWIKTPLWVETLLWMETILWMETPWMETPRMETPLDGDPLPLDGDPLGVTWDQAAIEEITSYPWKEHWYVPAKITFVHKNVSSNLFRKFKRFGFFIPFVNFYHNGRMVSESHSGQFQVNFEKNWKQASFFISWLS